MHIAIVVNPKARRIRGDRELVSRLVELCRRESERRRIEMQPPGRFEVRVSEGLAALPGELAALCDQGVDVIVPCGGDGTIGEVVTALQALSPAKWPALSILPAGTMNTVARNLSLRGRPDELLARLFAAISGPRGLGGVGCFPQDVLALRSAGGPSELPRSRCGFMFSAAMGARYLHAYAKGKRPGLFVNCALRHYELFGGTRADQNAFHYGWAVPGWRMGQRYLSYENIRDWDYLFLELHGRARTAPSDLEVRRVDRFNADADDLWAKVGADFRIAIVRDSRYLNWRYASATDHDYRLFECRERGSGALRHLPVVQPRGGRHAS